MYVFAILLATLRDGDVHLREMRLTWECCGERVGIAYKHNRDSRTGNKWKKCVMKMNGNNTFFPLLRAILTIAT
jgi:hypothetical protein